MQDCGKEAEGAPSLIRPALRCPCRRRPNPGDGCGASGPRHGGALCYADPSRAEMWPDYIAPHDFWRGSASSSVGIFQHIDRALERWARRRTRPFTAARRPAPDGWTRCKPLHHCCSITGAWPAPRLDDGSRMTRECHVRFCERLRGKSRGRLTSSG